MIKLPEELVQQMQSSISQEESDEMAIPSYTHKNPIMRQVAFSRVKMLICWMKKYQRKTSNIIDYGCGTGIILPSASNQANMVYGIDLTLAPANLLVDFYQLPNVILMHPDAIAKKLPDNTIDLIICGEVLEHIPDLTPILLQFQQKMVKNAHLIVSLPTENFLYKLGRKLAGFSGEYHLSTSRKIHQEILKSGFKQIRKKSLPFLGPFAIYWVIDYVWIN